MIANNKYDFINNIKGFRLVFDILLFYKCLLKNLER
jgi:hypothetical protein